MLSKNVLIHRAILFFILTSIFGQCASQIDYDDVPPKRELRGAWIASVANIDWPSSRSLSTEQQQNEFIRLINHHQSLGINALFVQVRTASDAFYAQSDEPWSEYLTGRQGKAPSPYYDPMIFMIENAHERNMEFHAWLNLNRGTHGTGKGVTVNHITRTHPHWFLTYNGTKVYNFGIPEVRNYILNLVMNIVRNYDVDGIHFDDYFYPYPISGQKINDYSTFYEYRNGFNNIEDWRRNNVNILIKDISEAIKKEKPYVKFGVSPFSVWRNSDRDISGSYTNGALSSYDDLYADSRLWAQEGWVDYSAPQVYFSLNHKTVPYKPMVDWWVRHKGNHHLYIGLASYRVGENNNEWRGASQIMKQLRLNENTRGVHGAIFYNTKSIMNTRYGLPDSLRNHYRYPALPPVMEWKESVQLSNPVITSLVRNSKTQATLTWQIKEHEQEHVRSFIIYRFVRGERRTIDDPRKIVAIVRNKDQKIFVDRTLVSGEQYEYAISSLDRLSNESKPSSLHKLR